MQVMQFGMQMDPALTQEESVACDKCNCWFHYKCVGLKGTESFLTRDNSTWFCTSCSKKGKGRGRGQGKGCGRGQRRGRGKRS